MKKQVFGLVILLLASPTCFSQRVQWKAFRFTEENDIFNLTQRGIDRYYTQGARLEFLYEPQRRKFSEKLLIQASGHAQNVYSIGLSQQVYTPRHKYDLDFVGDMPYAGTLYFSNKLDSYDSAKHLRLLSRLDAGIIGPLALGEQTQGLVHKLIHNKIPAGWDTQLRNDVLLNYWVRLEKRIMQDGLFEVEGKIEANAGTVLISAVGGMNLKLGNWQRHQKFTWEVFFMPEIRAMAYNSLLQGGIFNRLYADQKYSEYFLKRINPWVYSHSTGFQVRYQQFELLYKQVNLAPEFAGQLPHYFGVFTFTWWLKK